MLIVPGLYFYRTDTFIFVCATLWLRNPEYSWVAQMNWVFWGFVKIDEGWQQPMSHCPSADIYTTQLHAVSLEGHSVWGEGLDERKWSQYCLQFIWDRLKNNVCTVKAHLPAYCIIIDYSFFLLVIDVCGKRISNAYVTYSPLNIHLPELKLSVIFPLSAFAGW